MRLQLELAAALPLYNTVHFQATGIGTFCWDDHLVEQALECAGIHREKPDFKIYMRDFILMYMDRYAPARRD